MPQSPRSPRRPSSPTAPRAPRPPRLGRLRLSPLRSEGSAALDGAITRRGKETLPPYQRWHDFLRDWEWEQGEHVTTVGPVGSGKTVLNRYLLRRRDFVVVLGVKQKDKELFQAFEQEGYERVARFDAIPPEDADSQRLIFAPTSAKHGAESRKERSEKFRRALNDVYDVGNWCVYCDDVQYLSDQLRTAEELEELWLVGRSEGVSVVASSQEPVHIPVMAYGMATHLFLFRQSDKRRAERMAELTGVNREIAMETIMRLPHHEFVYINTRTGKMVRSMVIR